MALLRAEAEKLQLPFLLKGVVDEIITIDDSFNVVPFKNISPQIVYEHQRELSLGTQAAQAIDPHSDLTNESGATFTKVTTKPTVLAASVDIPRMFRGDNQQIAVQIAKKAKQVGLLFGSQAVTGDGALPNMQSFPYFIGGANFTTFTDGVHTFNGGGTLTLDQLDRLCDLVPMGANALIMNDSVIRRYKTLLRAAGGTDAAMMQLPNFSAPVLTFNGIPILKNNNIGKVEATTGALTGGVCTSVYAVRFNEDDGVCGIINGSSAFEVTGPVPVVRSDRDNYTVAFRTNLVMHSTWSVARLRGCTDVS